MDLAASELVYFHDPDTQFWVIVHEYAVDPGSVLRQLGLEPGQGAGIFALDFHAPAYTLAGSWLLIL